MYNSNSSHEGDLNPVTQHLDRKILGGALGRGETPTVETVGDIFSIAGSATETVVEVTVVNRATVVESGGSIGGLGILLTMATSLRHKLLQTVASGGSLNAVLNHLQDLVRWARADTITGTSAIMRLHQSWVGDTVVGSRDADAALALLHDDSQNETRINARRSSYLVDRAVDGLGLFSRVILTPTVPGAGLADGFLVGFPESIKRTPAVQRRPASSGRAIALVADVGIGDGSISLDETGEVGSHGSGVGHGESRAHGGEGANGKDGKAVHGDDCCWEESVDGKALDKRWIVKDRSKD